MVEIVIHEGKKRQVRRMFDAIGHPVQELSRTAYGGLRLGTMAVGSYRRLCLQRIWNGSLRRKNDKINFTFRNLLH